MHILAPYPAIVDPLAKVGISTFSEEELDQVVKYGDRLIQEQAIKANVGFGPASENRPEIRVSDIAWFPMHTPETAWIYERAGFNAQEANSFFWQFDITGFADMLQYVVYRADDPAGRGHYDFHMDMGDGYGKAQRKLSFSLMLSNQGEDYEGGDFMLYNGGERPATALNEGKPLRRGQLVVFPAWAQHAVRPVTRGERRVLVGWLCGPKFR
jgi:PKHD-type hydroxylase